MKSDVFHFKQFDVCQKRSAMKVGMDGVTLGAWALDGEPGDRLTVWDVGTGTGLVALMIAQRYPQADIYAIEIDQEAAAEAADNFLQSPFSDRLHAVGGDVFDVAEALPLPDAIVSNPPYFRQSLSAPDEGRNMARHEGRLGVESLISLASRCLGSGGRLAMILPSGLTDIVEFNAALGSMGVDSRVDVMSVVGKSPVRTLWQLVKGQSGRNIRESIVVRTATGDYTAVYKTLTNEFYLDKNDGK